MLRTIRPLTQAALLAGFLSCLMAAGPGDAPQPASPPPPAPAPAAPASGPATQPAGTPIKGRVAIPANWSLQKPDLTRTILYLASAPTLDKVPPPVAPAIVAQHNKAFEPNFVVIALGTTVEFPNWDKFEHNVFSRSKAAPAFDLSRYPYGESKARKFDKIGPVQVFCNIHPDMRALIYVAPNPFFARADQDGNFTVANVPPGDYELVVWNERCKELRQKVTVGQTAGPDLALTLQEDRGNIMANDPPAPRTSYSVERGLGVKREVLNLPVVEECHPSPVPPPSK